MGREGEPRRRIFVSRTHYYYCCYFRAAERRRGVRKADGEARRRVTPFYAYAFVSTVPGGRAAYSPPPPPPAVHTSFGIPPAVNARASPATTLRLRGFLRSFQYRFSRAFYSRRHSPSRTQPPPSPFPTLRNIVSLSRFARSFPFPFFIPIAINSPPNNKEFAGSTRDHTRH